MNISDGISLGSLFLALIGGVFAYFQWRKSISIKKAEYVNGLLEKIYTDSEINEVFYIIDYGKSWYTDKFHDSKDLERKIDKTLSFLSYICYLKYSKIISRNEFSFFEYKIIRLLSNPDAQGYLFNLYHFSKHIKVTMSYNYIIKYGKENRILSNIFFDKDSIEFSKYKKLNY